MAQDSITLKDPAPDTRRADTLTKESSRAPQDADLARKAAQARDAVARAKKGVSVPIRAAKRTPKKATRR